MENNQNSLSVNNADGTSFSASVVSTNSASTIREQSKVEHNSHDYIPFGTDNLFPQGLAILNRRSSTHRSILHNKATYSLGRGFITEGNKELEKYLKRVNTNRESLRKVLKKVFQDWYSFGNAYIEVVLVDGRPPQFFHHDATKVRIHKDRKNVIIHPDWAQYEGKKDYAKVLPLYPEFKKVGGYKRAIFHYKQYEPEFCDYGLPTWVAALDPAAISYKTNRWNLSRLENSFQVSGILEMYANMSPEKMKETQEMVKNFSGEENVGKILSIVKTHSESGENTNWIPLTQQSEGEWQKLHDQANSDLIVAHNWFRSLSGIADSTGFDTKRIRNEYQVAKNTVIGENQDTILSEIIDIIEDNSNLKVDGLAFRNESPVSLIDLVDVNSIITVNEARENSLGLAKYEDEEKGNKLIAEIREETIQRGSQKETAQTQIDGDTDN